MSATTAKPKVAAGKKRAASTEHPSYKDMIIQAITNLKERMGSSRHAIKKYIHANYPGLTGNVDSLINVAIKRGVDKNDFAQPKGPSGPIKLVKKTKSEGEKKPAVKKAAKPAAKKAAPKKSGDSKKATAKKAAPKKSATGAKKSATATKKAAPKKSATAKKPAAAKKAATGTKKAASTTKKSPAKKATATKKA